MFSCRCGASGPEEPPEALYANRDVDTAHRFERTCTKLSSDSLVLCCRIEYAIV
jgi:hypothetical protein